MAGEGPGGFEKAEVASGGKLIEIHLLEKYLLRLGPTLPLWELCFEGGWVSYVAH